MCSGDCFKRPDQLHKMPGCRVVALFWVRPNHHEQRNGEQQGWEQSNLGWAFSQCRWSRSSGVSWWRLLRPYGAWLDRWIRDQRVTGSDLTHCAVAHEKNYSHIMHVPLPPSGTIWHRPKVATLCGRGDNRRSSVALAKSNRHCSILIDFY